MSFIANPAAPAEQPLGQFTPGGWGAPAGVPAYRPLPAGETAPADLSRYLRPGSAMIAGPAPAAATPPPAAPPPAAPPLSATQQSAWAILAQTLTSYGFSGTDLANLENFVQTELINGTGTDQINLDLMQTPEFAKRFPAIVSRRNAGLPPISPAEYVTLERQYAQLERAAGLPQGFGDYNALIANDVSPSELSSRIQKGYVAMLQAPREALQALSDYYGLGQGTMAAYFLDPTKAEPIVEQQAQAALIGGAGIRTGYGEPTAAQALRLAELGISESAAQQGFMNLVHQRQLEGTLPGQAQQALTPDQLLGSEFGGDQATKDLLARRAEDQKAAFAGSTAFRETATGITGLGPVVR